MSTHTINRVVRRLIMGVLMTALTVATAYAGPDRHLPPLQVRMDTGAAVFDGQPVGTASVAAHIGLGSHIDLLLGATGVHTLERTYKDGVDREYQAEIGWTSTGIRPFLSLGKHVEIGLPLRTGMGVVQFRYNREYRDELSWTEEIIDRVDVAVNTIGVDVAVTVTEGWSIRGEAGFRGTSPLRTVADVENDALSGWYGTIGAVYHVTPRRQR